MIDGTRLSVSVVAEPGLIRDGILAILRSYDSIGSISVLSAAQYLEGKHVDQPDIVLFDASTKPNGPDTIQSIKDMHPDCYLVVNHARARGAADMVLAGGFTNQALYRIFQDIVMCKASAVERRAG